MEKLLLTRVITRLVNKYASSQEYGVSIINIPDFDYSHFISNLKCDRKIAIYFLGFSNDTNQKLSNNLPNNEQISIDYTVEAAEASRNSGDESIFRVIIIKRTELEKISSLKWFPTISLEMVYTKSCDYVKKALSGTNSVVEALIQALRSKPVRSILSFERVLEYLEILTITPTNEIPDVIKSSFYMLGLCADKSIDVKNPSREDFISRIKRNHAIVERLSNLEQAERQGITNYYAKGAGNQDLPRLILSFYKTKNIELLKQMELGEVESCLKAASSKKSNTTSSPKTSVIKPTSLAAQLIFDDNKEQISEILSQLEEHVDQRPNQKKTERVDVDIEGGKAQFQIEPATERIAEQMTTEDDFGGIIRAELQSPDEALRELDKYEYFPFKRDYLDKVWYSLKKISEIVSDGEKISSRLKAFLSARDKLLPYRKRLQDAPMLQVLDKYELFSDYLSAYEELLNAINDDFPNIWRIAPSNAKEIINTIMSLDYVFVVGETKAHAIPTPMHPLYLWKFIELAKEMLSSKGVSDLGEVQLSETDKTFIVRKSDDIPDPLSVVLLPVTIEQKGAAFLPLSGRIGMLPVYSNVPQINQSENGIDTLKQSIIRYLCLYPHAEMMLKLCIIDPPSVETIVSMLKALNNDKEFNIEGIEVSIFRTKEVPSSWIEINDSSLNDGMLGKVKGKRSLSFRLKISHQKSSYSKILSDLTCEQHLIIIFDPNEVRIEKAQNNKQIHIHPLCVPMVYKYNPIDEKVEIRPASDGGIFTIYSSIIEKLNEHPSVFSHTGTSFYTPLSRDTYDRLLQKSDWLVILDQSLKSWDTSLRAASEKLFYRENDYRSIGIYSSNCNKFILGYDALVKRLGNFIPTEVGLKNVIKSIREINNDGLLSIVSHTSGSIFDANHGKGSLGIALAAIHYKRTNPEAFLVGLDTQLAQEWLSDREDGNLPDLIGINLDSDCDARIDIIEVKTYSGNTNSFTIDGESISGHAVKQVSALDGLVKEMLGATEKITTVSRREILRQQVFEGLFQAELDSTRKLKYSEMLNELFAGKYEITVQKNIAFVDFENADSTIKKFKGLDQFEGNEYFLITIGSREIQSILSNIEYTLDNCANVVLDDNSLIADKTEKKVIDANSIQIAEDLPNSTDNDTIENTMSDEQKSEINERCARINKVFRDYGINAYPVKPEMVQEAARFTRFSVELKPGESVKSLERRKTDLGIQLEANGEIMIDHIKGTKYLSVDIPFVGARSSISLIEHLKLLDSSNGALDIVAGQKPDGSYQIIDIATAPHMLIAGTTGSGKTIFLHSILVSLLHQYTQDEIELLIIDPKQTDFIFFEGLPHLYGGHVVIDAEEALEMLQRINNEDKEQRTAALRSCKSKDIQSYNEKNPTCRMKRLVVIIDEYSDLIQASEILGTRKEFEKNLLMLLQRVRNLGIHLIIATQRPSAQIVTGALKVVIPFRVSFRLPSHTDSQTILDMSGAENLLGKGDMLVVTESDTMRLQGLYISEEELEEFISKQ